MEVFWSLGRDPCAMARVFSARRWDQLPFRIEDFVAGSFTYTAWWDKYYPSANVKDWLDETVNLGDIDGYFGPYDHKEAGMVPPNYTAPFAKGSVSGCRLAGSPDPQEYLSVWNPDGPPLNFQQDIGHNAFQVSVMNWSDSIVQNQESIEMLMDPRILQLYVFGRLLREATKATGKRAPSISAVGVLSDHGWHLYPLFASLGPKMVRMYNWVVVVGFIRDEDPLLRDGSRGVATTTFDDIPLDETRCFSIRLGGNGPPEAACQPGTSNIVVKPSTSKNRQRKLHRKALEEANARKELGDVEAMETSDREAVTLPPSAPHDEREIRPSDTIDALLNLTDSEMEE
ncbi:unnamed protein product [Calypogeia fissa]